METDRLVGYGLFAAREIAPSTPLFTIPAAALLNSLSLSRHYPKSKPNISAVQLISLHLLLHRPGPEGTSLDPLFGPYLSTLPQNFDTHPLVWHLKRNDGTRKWVVDSLPVYVQRDLERVAKSFQKDWKQVRSYLVSVSDPFSFFSFFTFFIRRYI